MIIFCIFAKLILPTEHSCCWHHWNLLITLQKGAENVLCRWGNALHIWTSKQEPTPSCFSHFDQQLLSAQLPPPQVVTQVCRELGRSLGKIAINSIIVCSGWDDSRMLEVQLLPGKTTFQAKRMPCAETQRQGIDRCVPRISPRPTLVSERTRREEAPQLDHGGPWVTSILRLFGNAESLKIVSRKIASFSTLTLAFWMD